MSTSSSTTTTLSTSTTLTGTSTRRQRYDVALNGQGFILASKPETPKLFARQDDVFGQRFAAGDRDYNDLAKWWYMAQTDWSGGEKDVVSWLNDAKYYYSTNIDAYSEQGAIKLASNIILDSNFTEQISCGAYLTVAATTAFYIGTDDTFSTKPAIYKNDSATNISDAFMSAAQTAVTDVVSHKDKLWFGTLGAGSTYVVGKCDQDGANPVDYSAAIGTACDAITPTNCYCLADDSNVIYAGIAGTDAQNYIVKSVDGGTNWVKVLSTGYRRVVCILINGSNIYFLAMLPGSSRLDFRLYSGSAETLIYFFSPQSFILGSAGNGGSISRRGLHFFNNLIYVTIRDQIWTYNISTGDFNRVYLADENKLNISNILAVGDMTGGGTILIPGGIAHSNKLYWANLLSDGESFYNNKREILDENDTYRLVPLFSNGSIIYWVDNNDFSKLYKDSGFKGATDKNYIVFNNFDKISAVDKLAYSIDLIFKTLVSGDKIAVEYTTGELTSSTSWTVLGNANYNDDGAIAQKTLYFGDAVLFKKIWFRVKLEGGGTTTVSLYDFVLAYLPMPDYRLHWDFTVKCEDEMQRKDQSKEPKNGVWLRNLLQKSWLTKSILTFEDFDADTYDSLASAHTATVTTITVNNNTDQFPEVGRLLIGTEEIFYTGKTKTTFTGCARGARGTNKVAHPINEAVTMGHRVIIRNYQEELIIANEPTKAEYLITLALSEV